MHRKIFAVILAGVLSLLTLTACGTSEFGMTENTEKRMVITAERAAKDDFFLVGSLKVDEGEQITISSDLEKGSVRVEIFRWGEEQDADTLPETGEPSCRRRSIRHGGTGKLLAEGRLPGKGHRHRDRRGSAGRMTDGKPNTDRKGTFPQQERFLFHSLSYFSARPLWSIFSRTISSASRPRQSSISQQQVMTSASSAFTASRS